MYYSFQGNITLVRKDFVVIEVGGIGFQVFVPHIEDYQKGDNVFIYVYQVVREDEQYLVGFKSEYEKEAFLSLISVKGIGPRTALGAMSATSAKDLFSAIAANNITFLKKLPGIGAKAASQIILDLKGQLTGTPAGNPNQYDEVRDALKGLGYKVKEIESVLATINEKDATNEDILRLALKKLKK
ncbi:MAG: Holliday junction branch migration protein RuvA [Bacilli bacterium]|jgi:Holliday junction DNA helicase RuvA|nr:Holliday junction branch migration protein RuvA [Bacilli bacterium]